MSFPFPSSDLRVRVSLNGRTGNGNASWAASRFETVSARFFSPLSWRVEVGRFENGSGQLCQRSDRNGNLVEEFTYGEADGLKFDLSYKLRRSRRTMALRTARGGTMWNS